VGCWLVGIQMVVRAAVVLYAARQPRICCVRFRFVWTEGLWLAEIRMVARAGAARFA
jgi:hypothetical protein